MRPSHAVRASETSGISSISLGQEQERTLGLLALSFTILFSPWLWLSTASGCCHCIDDTWVPGSLTSQGLWALIGLIRMLCSQPKRSASNDEEAVWTQWEIRMRTRSWAWGLAPAKLSCPENPSEAPVCPDLLSPGSLQRAWAALQRGTCKPSWKQESSLQDHIFLTALIIIELLILPPARCLISKCTEPEPLHHCETRKKQTTRTRHWTWSFTDVYLLNLQRDSALQRVGVAGWRGEGGLPSGSPLQSWTWMQSQFSIAQKPPSIFRIFRCVSPLTFMKKGYNKPSQAWFYATINFFSLGCVLRLALMSHVVTLQSEGFQTILHSHQRCVGVQVAPVLVNISYLLCTLWPSWMWKQVLLCVWSFILA